MSFLILIYCRAAKSCWGPKKFKEAFCVDSSVEMNNLALALIQGGVFPNQPNSASVGEEEETKQEVSTLKGLYFRQFMPVSTAVSLTLYANHLTLSMTVLKFVRLNTI